MASPSQEQYLRALERTPPTTKQPIRNVKTQKDVLSEAGKRQKQRDDQRRETLKQQWRENEQEKQAAQLEADEKGKQAAQLKADEKGKRAGESKAGKKTGDGAQGKKAGKRKEQADNQKQRTLTQIWPQQKPTSESKTIKEDEDTARTKRQRIH